MSTEKIPSCVCRTWSKTVRSVERLLGKLDCRLYPSMHDAELLFLVNRFRHVLSGLCLAGCEAVSDVALSPVVHLGRPDGDSGKMELAGEGSRAVLTALNLRGCKGLTEVCLSQLLMTHRTSLQTLDVSHCPAGRDSVLRELFDGGGGQQLQHLKLIDCGVGDHFAFAVASRPRTLTVLNLCGCRAVCDFPLARAVQACGALQELHLASTQCSGVFLLPPILRPAAQQSRSNILSRQCLTNICSPDQPANHALCDVRGDTRRHRRPPAYTGRHARRASAAPPRS